jgi:hypothetical protein
MPRRVKLSVNNIQSSLVPWRNFFLFSQGLKLIKILENFRSYLEVISRKSEVKVERV